MEEDGEQAAAQHPKTLDITSYQKEEISVESTEMRGKSKEQLAEEPTDKQGREGPSTTGKP